MKYNVEGVLFLSFVLMEEVILLKTAISPERRAQLQLFTEKVTQARRQAGRRHKDLAAALGLDSHVLSRKMRGGGRNRLTQPEVKQMIQTLAAWDAITSQALLSAEQGKWGKKRMAPV